MYSWKNTMSRLYVGDLGSYGANRLELIKAFSPYGEVEDVWVAKNPPGFAFVYFSNEREARSAVRGMDGKQFNGRTIRVEVATGGKNLDEMREIRRIRSSAYSGDGPSPKRPISVSPPRYQGSFRYSSNEYGSRRGGRGSQRDNFGSRRGHSSFTSSSSSFSRDGQSSYRRNFDRRDSYGQRSGGRASFTKSSDRRDDSSSYRGRYSSNSADRSRGRGQYGGDSYMTSRYEPRSRSRSPQHGSGTSYSGYRGRGNERDYGREYSRGRPKYSGGGSSRGRGYGTSRYGNTGDSHGYGKYRKDDEYRSRGSYRGDDSGSQNYGEESTRPGSSFDDSYDRTQRKSSWVRDDAV